jgi:hypothetical protein
MPAARGARKEGAERTLHAAARRGERRGLAARCAARTAVGPGGRCSAPAAWRVRPAAQVTAAPPDLSRS